MSFKLKKNNGFKDSEGGQIPVDWDVTRLGEVADVFRGGSPRPIERYLTLDPKGINWIKIGDVKPGAKYLSSTKEKIKESGVLYSRQVKKGDFLLSNSMSFGRPYILKVDGCIHDGWLVIQNYEKTFDKDFLFYILGFETTISQYKSLASGSSVLNLNKEIVQNIFIGYPKKKEQNRIATLISDVDDLIASLGALIAKKQAIKKGTMQQLLTGKKRLPGFSGEWEMKRLGDVAEIINGGTPSTKNKKYWDGNIPWCTPTDITSTKTKYISNTKRKISFDGLNKSSASLLPKGALLFCSRATIGEIKISNVEMTTNQGFKSLLCKNGIHNEFLYYLIIQNKEIFKEKAFGSTFLEISKSNMASVEFLFPDYEEQNSIALILSNIESEIQALQQKRDKYKQIKQGMMQELLTGKTRLE